MLTFDEAVEKLFVRKERPSDEEFEEINKKQYEFSDDIRNNSHITDMIDGPIKLLMAEIFAISTSIDYAIREALFNAINFGVVIGVQMEKKDDN